ncbi:MAG TPA: TRAP transporter fused permease subunit [Burkholderiales bacterium]|jgi:TRAP transporter 4TM/12TM fusion protein|nr:TRAP transporter fused permease subunit [Burkholderiales bacterium]
MLRERFKSLATLSNLILVFGAIQFAWLVWYFYTGYGGSQELVARVMSIALILQILFMYRQGQFYKWLPMWANHVIVASYIGICLYAFYYFHVNFEDIAIYRQGSYTQQDFVVGLLVFLLVMELSRLAHPSLFWVNIVLVAYTLWGYLSPVDFFWHPGTSFYRIVTSSTVELSTGIYGIYGQLALTLIAAFLLLAAVANGFGAQHAMINVMRRFAGRSRQLVPQTAVMGSLAVGMISGSGSANAIVVGTITIPLMKRYGVPGTFAGAIESAASMGGLIMPPMMGVGAFLMSEFLGVPYWDVVVRGFALALVYYATLALVVYLLCVRLLPRDTVAAPKVPLYDQVKTGIFFLSVAFLIVLLGYAGLGELLAALYTGVFMLVLLLLAFLYFKYLRKDPIVTGQSLFANLRIAIETHAEMTSYLTLLLATLGVMIGLFTVTGFINRMGAALLSLGAWNIVAMILMAYAFGWLVGAGLPPTATYIIGAVIIVGPMREMGVNPWVAHFFVFLLSVWGELSPPTSLTAAVAARIAEASFMRTMWEALKISLPITLMTFAIFARTDMVVNPGWLQIGASLLVLIGTCSIGFAMFGRFVERPVPDVLLRITLACLALVAILYPDTNVAMAAAAFALPATIFGVWRHQRIASPKGELQSQPAG